MKGKRCLVLAMGFLAIGMALFASGQSAATAPRGLDTSKKVSLEFWMLGNAARDLQLVQDKVNEMALRDLNATVKFNYTTWTDWSQKYQLLLTSGQPIDLIFTAEWTDYQRYARSGAFKELDGIVPTAAPALYKFVPKEYWDGVRVGGKIYTMPATWKEYVYDGFEYREDLRKKYKLPEIKSVETMEAYLSAIVKNEPGMAPLGESVADYQFSTIISFTAEMLHPWLDRGMPKYGLASMNSTPRELYAYWGSAEHVTDLKLFKKWADAGYWSRSILSSKEDVVSMFREGRLSAKMGGINPNKYADDVINIATNHPDWEVGYYPYSRTTGIIHPVHPTHNGFAVPISSQNPERAVAFFEKIVTDKAYNRLTNYGIEGVHYAIDNGYYTMIGDQTSNGFPREAMNCWAWRNPEYMLFTPAFDPVKKLFAEFDTFATPDLFNGFAENYTPFQTERTALMQVQAQYLAPLQAGLVDDVNAGLTKFLSEAKKAGLDTIQAEYKKQWLAYCDDMKIK